MLKGYNHTGKVCTKTTVNRQENKPVSNSAFLTFSSGIGIEQWPETEYSIVFIYNFEHTFV